MSIFDFDQGQGDGNYWNMAHPEQPNFTDHIQGDVVKIAAVPKTKYQGQPGEYDTFPDGNPKTSFEVTLGNGDDEVVWTFNPDSNRRPSNAMTAIRQALQAQGMEGRSLSELQGLNITVSTVVPPQGFTYSQANPRPFTVQVNGQGSLPFLGMEDKVTPLRQKAQQQRQQPQAQPQQQQVQNPAAQQVQQSYNRAQQAYQQAYPQGYNQVPYGPDGYPAR